MAEAGSVQLNQRAGSIGNGNSNIGEAIRHMQHERAVQQLNCHADRLIGRLSSSIPAVRQSAFAELSAFARRNGLTNDDVLKAAAGARGRVGAPTSESDAHDLACAAPPRLRQGGFPGGNSIQQLHRELAPRNP